MVQGDVFSRSNDIKIAVIGGGTGSFTLLTGLKHYSSKIAALVNMADDGGSTGKLRDELGALPPGDVRQCLVALSRTPELRDLFNYRFSEGSLGGHAFGNLFITALEKMTGDFGKAVELASEVLNIAGTVEPVTLTDVRLVLEQEGVPNVVGEFQIAHEKFSKVRPNLRLEPDAEANPKAVKAILESDMVVVAPGNLYGSLAPALIIPGIAEALKKTKALRVYVCNLVTKPGQTDGFCVSDYAKEIERLVGGSFLDVVLYNNETPSKELLEKYAKQGEEYVREDDMSDETYDALGANLISNVIWSNPNKSDPIAEARTLIRHDSDAVAKALISVYRQYRAELV